MMTQQEQHQQQHAAIFRYKFSSDMTDELFRFAKIHQYEDRETFKESWASWVQDTDEMIQLETDRLRADNYRGNILVKMFKSTKYYFCNKSMAKTRPVERKVYAKTDTSLMRLMDSHIRSIYDLPPKIGFIQFCELYAKDSGDATLKKKYKNRHFRIVRDHAKMSIDL